MSLGAALHGAHERCCDMRIATVAVRGKHAMSKWSPTTPGPDRVSKLIDRPSCTGLAAILGSPSGDLVARDWDDREAYRDWAERFPRLARTLPTVEAARGFHVYARATGVKTVRVDDGELRASGSYILMPPSLTVDPPPQAPRQYRWVVPLPGRLDEIPTIEPEILLPDGHPCIRRNNEAPDPGGPPNPQYGLCQLPIDGIDIPECIRRTLPTGPGQRNRCLFDLARWLRAILPDDTDEAMLRGIASEWYRAARPVIRTHDVRVSQRDLVNAWRNVTIPAGCSWQQIVEVAAADPWRPRLGGAADRIARLLRAAGMAHGGRDFPVDYRTMAKASDVTPWGAHVAAVKVERAGYAMIVDRGEPNHRAHKATTWRWLNP